MLCVFDSLTVILFAKNLFSLRYLSALALIIAMSICDDHCYSCWLVKKFTHIESVKAFSLDYFLPSLSDLSLSACLKTTE